MRFFWILLCFFCVSTETFASSSYIEMLRQERARLERFASGGECQHSVPGAFSKNTMLVKDISSFSSYPYLYATIHDATTGSIYSTKKLLSGFDTNAYFYLLDEGRFFLSLYTQEGNVLHKEMVRVVGDIPCSVAYQHSSNENRSIDSLLRYTYFSQEELLLPFHQMFIRVEVENQTRDFLITGKDRIALHSLFNSWNFDSKQAKIVLYAYDQNQKSFVYFGSHIFRGVLAYTVTHDIPFTFSHYRNAVRLSGNISQSQTISSTAYSMSYDASFFPEKHQLQSFSRGKRRFFSLDIPLSSKGITNIEINTQEGYALINTYVNTDFPKVIPVFQDTLMQEYDDIPDERRHYYALQLINLERQLFQRNTLQSDNVLDQIAQKKAEDMKRQKYIAHVSPQGEGINDIAQQFFVYQSLGENIALSSSVYQAHLGLVRSATHRNAMLDDQWGRVGLGFVSYNDQLLMVQVFAPHEPHESQVTNIQNEMISLFSDRGGVFSESLYAKLRETQNIQDFSSFVSSRFSGIRLHRYVFQHFDVSDIEDILSSSYKEFAVYIEITPQQQYKAYVLLAF